MSTVHCHYRPVYGVSILGHAAWAGWSRGPPCARLNREIPLSVKKANWENHHIVHDLFYTRFEFCVPTISLNILKQFHSDFVIGFIIIKFIIGWPNFFIVDWDSGCILHTPWLLLATHMVNNPNQVHQGVLGKDLVCLIRHDGNIPGLPPAWYD